MHLTSWIRYMGVAGLFFALATEGLRDAQGGPAPADSSTTSVVLLEDSFSVFFNQWTSGCYGGAAAYGLEEEPQQIAVNFWQGYFPNWKVPHACISLSQRDRIGPGPFDIDWCVDISGSQPASQPPPGTPRSGMLELRNALDLEPGTYRLSFDMAGPHLQGIYGADRIVVSVEDLFRETFTGVYGDSWSTVSRNFRVCEQTVAKIRIAQTGPVNQHGTTSFDGSDRQFWGCRVDNVKLERLEGDPALSSISPSQGGNRDILPVRIEGENWPSATAHVLLRGEGVPDITIPTVNLGCASEVLGAFDLRGAAPGHRDLVLEFEGGPTLVMEDAFRVETATGPELWMDILAPSLVRGGSKTGFAVMVGNRGNEAALGVPVWLRDIPLGVQVEPVGPIGQPALDAAPAVDLGTVGLTVDDGGSLAVPLFVPYLGPGDRQFIFLHVTVPGEMRFQIRGEIGQPLYELTPTANASFVTKRGSAGVRDRSTSVDWSALRSAAQNCRNAQLQAELECLKETIPFFSTAECAARILALLGAKRELIEKQAILDWLGKRTLWSSPEEGKALFEYYSDLQIAIEALREMIWESENDIGFLQTCGESWIEVVEDFKGINLGLSAAISAIRCSYERGKALGSCSEVWIIEWRIWSNFIESVVAKDPNDKIGNTGAPGGFTSSDEPMRYTIRFENVASATAPAARVAVIDVLDLSTVDVSTFEFGIFGFGSRVSGPGSSTTGLFETIDLRPATNLLVIIEGRLDPATGKVTWIFTSVDPTTGREPASPLLGFLPPNVAPPEGEGFVSFTIRPKAGLTSGTAIRNKASIVFDYNAPIETPEWVNTIDAAAPSSTVSAPAPGAGETGIQTSWSGQDDASGVLDYTVLVSVDGGAFVPWHEHTTARSATYWGQTGHTYRFRSVARDQTGNVEEKPGFDVEVALVAAPPSGGGAVGWELAVLALGAAGYALVSRRRARRTSA